MANEVKTLEIQLKGVEESLKDMTTLKKEVQTITALLNKMGKEPNDKNIKIMQQSIKNLEKSVEDLLMENKELKKSFDELSEAADKTAKNTEKIDKSVNFIEFKRGIKEASKELVQLATESFAAGKSMSETINEVGSGIGRVAFEFGPMGIAVGAVLTVLSPLVAKMFELTAAQKAANKVQQEAIESYAEEKVALDALFEPLDDVTISTEERGNLIAKINEEYGQYLPNLLTEKSTNEEIAKAYDLVNAALVRKAITQAKTTALEEATARRLKQELFSVKEIALNEEILTRSRSKNAQERVRIERENIRVSKEQFEQSIKSINEASQALEEQLGITKQVSKESKAIETSNERKERIEKQNDALKEQLALLQRIKDVEQKANQLIFDEKVKSIEDFDKLNDAQFKVEIDNLKAIAAVQDELDAKNEKKLDFTTEQLKAAKLAADEAERELKAANEANKSFEDRIKLQQVNSDAQRLISKDGIAVLNTDLAIINEVAAKARELNDPLLFTEWLRLNGYVTSITKEQEKLEDAIKKADDANKAANETLRIKENATRAIAGLDETAAEKKRKREDKIQELETRRATQNVENTRRAIETSLAAQIGADAELLRQGLATYNEAISLLKKQASVDKDKILMDTNATLNGFQRRFVSFAEGIAVVTKLSAEELNNLSGDELDQYNTLVNIAEATNAKIRLRSSQLNKDLTNSANDFYEKNKNLILEAFKSEIAQLQLQAESASFDFEQLFNDNFKATKAFADAALKARGELNQGEIDAIRYAEEQTLDALNAKHKAELDLQQKQTFDVITAVRKKFGSTAKEQEKANEASAIEQKKADLQRSILLAKQKDEFEKYLKAYEDLIKTQDLTFEEQVKNFEKWFGVIAQYVTKLSDSIFAYLDQQFENSISLMEDTADEMRNNLANVEAALSDSISKLSSLEDDLEGKRSGRRDAVLQAIEAERQREIALAETQMRLNEELAAQEKKIEEEKVKQANLRKSQAIGQAIIDTALGVTKALSQFGLPLAVPFMLAAGAAGAFQIATISKQKFADGGFTGEGSHVDETGHKVAGVVHDGEYVVPKWMVQSPKFANTVQSLEQSRMKGFATGGFTSPDYNGMGNLGGINEQKLLSRMDSMIQSSLQLAQRPIYTSVTEINNTQSKVARKTQMTTIGG